MFSKFSRIANVQYSKFITMYNSIRKLLFSGKLRFSEVLRMALRVLEYILFHRSGVEYPVFR